MIRKLDTQELIEEVFLSGKPSIVLFSIKGCVLCNKALSDTLPVWQNKYVKLNFYNIDVEENPDAVRFCKVDYAPTMLVMVGKEVLAGISTIPTEEIFLKMIGEIDVLVKNAPSFVKRISYFVRAVKMAIYNGQFTASKSIRKARLLKCLPCAFHLKGKCTECGCFVKWKTHLKTEKCPKGFWS